MFYQLASVSQWLTHSFIDCRLARDPHESQSVCMANRILFPPVSCIFPWWLVSFVAFGSIGMTERWLGSLLAIDKQSKCRQTGNKSIFGFCSARCTVNYVEMRTRFFFFFKFPRFWIRAKQTKWKLKKNNNIFLFNKMEDQHPTHVQSNYPILFPPQF